MDTKIPKTFQRAIKSKTDTFQEVRDYVTEIWGALVAESVWFESKGQLTDSHYVYKVKYGNGIKIGVLSLTDSVAVMQLAQPSDILFRVNCRLERYISTVTTFDDFDIIVKDLFPFEGTLDVGIATYTWEGHTLRVNFEQYGATSIRIVSIK
ncbi:hypothetical protein [Bacillus mycoides]|uniref:hypothetical protein n=1 Tax=Bacillus mycoides TaxID=1405 RepID=UPI003A80E6AB